MAPASAFFSHGSETMAPASAFFSHGFSSRTVCVMDASGRLGSALVKRLLKRGYNVHAAVQTQGEVGWFNGVARDQNKNLKIFHSDPFDYHSILDALKGCSGLFYAFEPPEDQSTYDENVVEVEVRAAHNMLEACAQTDTIEKVVFTSSATAIIWRDDQVSNSAAELDERHWSDINLCRKFKLWHALSKTLAEKTAWALAMDRGVNMVCINAGLLMSPDLSITNPYLKGAAEMYANGVLATVDLRFLVDAHVCVYEDVSTYGRYLCFNQIIYHSEDAAKLAKILTPSASQSQSYKDVEFNERIIQKRISNKKLKEVMVDFESGSQSHAASQLSTDV